MTPLDFERLISIDWSGAGSDSMRCGLRVAQWTSATGPTLLSPSSKPSVRSWSRDEALDMLVAELHPSKPRTAVAFDFAFGLPWGSDREVFGVTGWSTMVRCLDDLYGAHGTARATATAINKRDKRHCGGPYRFDESRNDFRFYVKHHVPYYRAIELFMPQAISVWYVGSGATVGFHTITGLCSLAKLLKRRDKGDVRFTVWPHEGIEPPTTGHVLLEGYPAAFPKLADYGPCVDQDQRDAWRMLAWMQRSNLQGRLERHFRLPVDALSTLGPNIIERVQFEGWIIGVS